MRLPISGAGCSSLMSQKSWRTVWKRWPICRCVAVTNDTADKMSRSVESAKKHRPVVANRPAHSVANRGLAASVLVLRAEEPRPRIADHVAPLVVQRTARPIAARTPDRIGLCVGGIGDVARRHPIGRICRVRNRATDDGAGCKATDNAKADPAAATARLGVVWNGDRGKREHTCGGDSGHRCLHVLTSSGNDRVAIVRLYSSQTSLSIHAPVRDISDAPKPPCVSSVTQIPTCDRNLGNLTLTSLANLSEIC